jgi:hypothetical protein
MNPLGLCINRTTRSIRFGMIYWPIQGLNLSRPTISSLNWPNCKFHLAYSFRWRFLWIVHYIKTCTTIMAMWKSPSSRDIRSTTDMHVCMRLWYLQNGRICHNAYYARFPSERPFTALYHCLDVSREAILTAKYTRGIGWHSGRLQFHQRRQRQQYFAPEILLQSEYNFFRADRICE